MNTIKLLLLFAGTLAAMPVSAKPAALSVKPAAPSASTPSGIVDTLTFGDIASERAHGMTDDGSRVVPGGLGQSARVLLPGDPQSWQGGSVACTMKIDPNKPNYFTLRLWGGEANPDRLLLFCEGKLVGYIHIGDVDLLDFGNDGGEPPLNGRFYYQTSPLPLGMTKGKTELHCEVRGIGPIWAYGGSFAQFQKPMTVPTHGIYRAYIHTDGYFAPPPDETQGVAPTDPPVRQGPGLEVMDALKNRVSHEVSGLLTASKPLNEMQMQFLARAYSVAWTPAYNSPQVISQVTAGLDQLFRDYRQNPKLAQHDPVTPNPEWFEFGPAGDAVRRLASPLESSLDQSISDGAGGTVTRRAAWSEMLQAGRDWHLQHRRQYTNQSMIVDLNIYLSNRGIAALDPAHARPDEPLRHLLYQSVGLEPWLGSETPDGPAKPLGDRYFELTRQGLSKELGFVGYYGEVLDWVTQIYDATRPVPGQPGDPKIKAQLVKLAHARALFRYPAVDADGSRAMRAETIVGWRDAHYPGAVTYAERTTWDASAVYAAAATLDPGAVGSAQQMFADNQFFASVQAQMAQNNSLRVTNGLLDVPDDYALLRAQPVSRKRLPMTSGQPEFVFADPEDGVLALRHGPEVLYVSLYWRARSAINFLARVHDITPGFDRIAVVRQEEEFEPSGLTYTRPDAIGGAAPGGVHYPPDLHSALAGETLPIAKVPAGDRYKPGDENVSAGRATFYRLRYGPYCIGMNTTSDKTFTLTAPSGPTRNLVSGQRVVPGATVSVPPLATVVLYTGK